MANLLLNQGTQSAVPTDLIGTLNYPIVKLDVGALGASSPFTGTLGAVTNFAGGTITSLVKGTISTGTINTGTINTGTVDSVSQFPLNSFGTTVTTGTNTLGTIKPAVSGSAIFVTDILVSAGTTTTLVIGMGGTSTPLIGTISLAANGGFVSNYRVPGSVISGSALVYQQSVGGVLSLSVNGFVR